MSEHGWRAFVSAGLEDWVVLHGGATAVFAVTDLAEGARLAQALAQVPGAAGAGVLLGVGDDAVTVRLTRDMWLLEERHIALARAVSTAARSVGAVPQRHRIQEVQLAVAATQAQADPRFWRAVLGYSPAAPDNSVDPLGHSSTVWMQELDPEKSLRHAMHMDVSLPREEAEARVKAALAAGGTLVRDQSPGAWILADRAGNKVCIAAWPDGAPMPAQ